MSFDEEDQTYVSEQIMIRLGFGNYLKQYHTNRVSVHCLFHNDKTPSMSIYLATGTYKCYGCGEYGTLRKLYRDRFGHSINQDLGIKYQPKNDLLRMFTAKTEDYSQPPQTDIALNGHFIPASRSLDAQSFLRRRGIPLKVAEQMKMFVGKKAYSFYKKEENNKEYFINFSDRLCIPVYENGHLISCEGRDMYGEQFWLDRAKNLGLENFVYKKCIYPKMSSTNTLYQLQKLNKNKKLYFVEGLLDLAVLRSCSFFNETNSTSIFGAAITNRQYYLLFQFTEFCYIIDNDLAGWNSLKALYNRIKARDSFFIPYGCKFIVPPCEKFGVKDIGDIPQKTGLTIQNCIDRNWLSDEKIIVQSEYEINQKIEYFMKMKETK